MSGFCCDLREFDRDLWRSLSFIRTQDLAGNLCKTWFRLRSLRRRAPWSPKWHAGWSCDHPAPFINRGAWASQEPLFLEPEQWWRIVQHRSHTQACHDGCRLPTCSATGQPRCPGGFPLHHLAGCRALSPRSARSCTDLILAATCASRCGHDKTRRHQEASSRRRRAAGSITGQSTMVTCAV